ncbi:MAG: hypothetical protein JOZ14_12020 [Acidobacteria bacterium]|nr:hypothetical protein [Acidobacteriota bacterium]
MRRPSLPEPLVDQKAPVLPGGGAVPATSSSRAELATIAEPILKAMNGDLP